MPKCQSYDCAIQCERSHNMSTLLSVLLLLVLQRHSACRACGRPMDRWPAVLE